MKVVTREELLKMQGVFAYAEHTLHDLPERLHIKYSNKRDFATNSWTEEEFPILTPDHSGGDSYEGMDVLENCKTGEHHLVSDLETGSNRMYEPMDKLYVVYSKEDVKSWVSKLERLLSTTTTNTRVE